MATPLDISLVPVVISLLAEHGVDAVFHTMAGGTYSPTTRLLSGGTPGTTTTKAVPLYEVDLRWIPESMVEEGDAETMIAGQNIGFTPKRGQTVEINGETWKVLKAEPMRTGTLIAAWRFHLRQ